jgi:CheY-like chemotaxis protein
MRDTVATSWRRLSDRAQRHADPRSTRGGQALPIKAPQLETWENEGGQTAHFVTPVRILIVDDDIPSASSLELMLHASGHSETRVAYSGHAALAIAAKFQPSLVLLELRLLDMSGHEVARLVRDRVQTHDLRLIALTSRREHVGRALARVAEFERYLLKPVAALDLSGILPMEGARGHCSQRES